VTLDEALIDLTRIDPRKAQIVEMRFFGGLTVEEIGEVLKVSTGTIKRDWRGVRRPLDAVEECGPRDPGSQASTGRIRQVALSGRHGTARALS